MKTQISRISHRPKKRYSGVYQQQGRMITDADWNELVDIVKERLGDVLGDLIGSGIPERNGLAIVREQETGEIKIHPGCLYIDGIRGEIQGNSTLQSPFPTSPLPPGERARERGQPIGFDEQPDFPLRPGSGPAAGDIIYADLWERPVISLEDLDLLDPGLHGADTCTRTQTMVQLKWCAASNNPEEFTQNPPKGDARLDVELRSAAVPTATDAETATNEEIGDRIGNHLFRLEVHAVDDPANPSKITLKWSSENAAEAFAYTAVEALPPGFVSRDWVYEFYTDTTERHLGVHLGADQPPGVQPASAELVPPDSDGRLTAPTTIGDEAPQYVRRWDGYCVLQRGVDGWALANRDIDGTETTVGTDRGIPLSLFDKLEAKATQFLGSVRFLTEDGVAKVTLHLAQLTLTLTLSETAEGALEPKHFVPGDYWLAVVRENAPIHERVSLLSTEPLGITHHYLTLPVVEDRDDWTFASSEDLRKFCFHSMTELMADRIGYDPCSVRWLDILERAEPESPPKPSTVQEAFDSLLENLDTTDIPIEKRDELPQILKDPDITTAQDALHRLAEVQGINACTFVGVKPYTMIADAFDGLSKEQDIALCLLRGDHLIEEDFASPAVYGLRLMSVDTAEQLEDKGRHLVIVALVGTDLHIRILGARGKKVVDKPESQLVAGDMLTALKRRLSPFPDESSLSQQHKQEIISDAILIAYHNSPAKRSIKITGTSAHSTFVQAEGDLTLKAGEIVLRDLSLHLEKSLTLEANEILLRDVSFHVPSHSQSIVLEADRVMATDCAFEQLDTVDNYVWSNVFRSATGQAVAVAQDGNLGDLWVTGSIKGEPVALCDDNSSQRDRDGDLFVLRTSSSGKRLWSACSNRSTGHGSVRGSALAVDTDGNVLVTGSFSGTVDFGCGLLDSEDGNELVKVSKGLTDLFVLQLKRGGEAYQPGWIHTSIKADDRGWIEARGIAIDGDNNVLLAGSFHGRVTMGVLEPEGTDTHEPATLNTTADKGLFVLKFSQKGDLLWCFQASGGSGSVAEGWAVAVDRRDDVLVTGAFSGIVKFGSLTVSERDDRKNLFVLKLKSEKPSIKSDENDPVWLIRSYDVGDGASLVEGAGVVADRKGAVLVTGVFSGEVDFAGHQLRSTGEQDLFVLKIDPDAGDTLWSMCSKAVGEGTGSVKGRDPDDPNLGSNVGIATDKEGNLFVTGSFSGSVEFGGGPLTATGETDLFVLKLQADSAPSHGYHHAWSHNFGGEGSTVESRGLVSVAPESLEFPELSHVVVMGSFSGDIDFGGEELATGQKDLFLLKLRSMDPPRPLVLVRPPISRAAEISWVGNQMSTFSYRANPSGMGRLVVGPRETLALATHQVGGRIEKNDIAGPISLMHAGLQNVPDIQNLRSISGVAGAGRDLWIQGNRTDQVLSRIRTDDLVVDAHSAIYATNNVIRLSGNSLVASSLTVIGNQFLGGNIQDRNVATVIGKSGLFVANQGRSRGASIKWLLEEIEESANVIEFVKPAMGLWQPSTSIGAQGGSRKFKVNVPSILKWTATPSKSWLAIESVTTDTVPGEVVYSVESNPDVKSRVGKVTVEITISRDGTSSPEKTITLEHTVTQCHFSIVRTTSTQFDSRGGRGEIKVKTADVCQWAVSTDAHWIELDGRGVGEGGVEFRGIRSVGYSVAANPNHGRRTGKVNIEGETVDISQAGITVVPKKLNFDYGAQEGFIKIVCPDDYQWRAEAKKGESWFQFKEPQVSYDNVYGTGSYDIRFGVEENIRENGSTGKRTISLTVAGRSFDVTQKGRSCNFSLSQKGELKFEVKSGTKTVSVDAEKGCRWRCSIKYTQGDVTGWLKVSPWNESGSKTVQISAEKNSKLYDYRKAIVTIGGQNFTVSQTAPSSSGSGGGGNTGGGNTGGSSRSFSGIGGRLL